MIDVLPASKIDNDNFYTLEAGCFGIDGDPDTMNFRGSLVGHRHCFKAVAGGTLIGGVISEATHDEWHVTSLFVDEKYRRRGVGSRLLQKVIDVAKRDIILDIKTGLPYLESFYAKFGFEKSRPSEYYHDGPDRLVLMRRHGTAQ